MPTINTSPSLGINLDYNGAIPYWDGGSVPSPQIGAAARGVDGHVYHWVKASATIAAAASPGTAVTITEPGFTAAPGAGGFTAPPAGVASGAYFWARKSTI